MRTAPFLPLLLLTLAVSWLGCVSDDPASPAGGPTTDTGVPPTTGPTAAEAIVAMGKGFNLGQMFESTQHPRTLAAARAKIDAYYDKGFRTVRIPITWTEPVGGDLLVNDAAVGDVNREHERLAVITEVIDYALSKPDLYVVINTHHEVTLKAENRAAVFERLWQDITELFGDRDHRLLFELLNEPHVGNGAMAEADVRALSTLGYNKIRAVDATRLVVIGGNQWFEASELARTWPSLEGVGGGTDDYLMATFHHYDPWTFCGDNQGDYADAWTEANVSGPMDTALTWANGVGGGIPVYIGEWGVGWQSVLPAMDCNNIRAWYATFDADQAAPKGIPTMVWDDGGWFRIYDHGTDTFENNLADCISGECDWTGTDQLNAACTPAP